MQAEALRRAFTGFFVERGHTLVESSGLIPHHPAAPRLTNAGMVQFIPLLTGEQLPPYPRATSVQKCFRTVDIEIIGDTTRHLTFFEMLGNFSFGDYFKEQAIPMAWELVTEVLGMDPARLWVTVHHDDDEAVAVWTGDVGVDPARIQRLGEDNFWEMAKGLPGPCGLCSEIYYDKGEEHGPAGGPEAGGPERYVEIWNLVFMQYRRQPDGSLVDLPTKNIDTGAGMERILPILQGVDSVFDTDVVRPVLNAAAEAIGRSYGDDPKVDRALRIMADHGRAMTVLAADGVVPSNDDRGYILRRIIRRAVRHASGLGVESSITPALVEASVNTLGQAYSDLAARREVILGIVGREEDKFRQTLRSGSGLLDEELRRLGTGRKLAGEVAFRLHDTFGFPLELTLEMAAERGVDVDVEGFEAEMGRQRQMGRANRPGAAGTHLGQDGASASAGGDGRSAVPVDHLETYRQVLEESGITEFTGYGETESEGHIVAILDAARAEDGRPRLEVFLDRSPFYAESGGQVGDTGTITSATGTVEVIDTTAALPGLYRHLVYVVDGELAVGQEVSASVDADRREAIRRNHTGTHLLHWALREVLGDHVKQAGSLVSHDRLRFDFSHYAPVSPDELEEVESLANQEVLANEAVRVLEMPKDEAAKRGAIAFFGEKYGDVVRVVEAGRRSVELCGGTHVGALGTIGPIRVISESSIGSNLRRIEAVTGIASFERLREERSTLGRTATLLKVAPPEVPDRVERLLDDQKALADELRKLRRAGAANRAGELAATAGDEGVVVARVDGVSRDELRDLALAVRDQPGVRAAVVGGEPEGGGVALVAAVAKGSGLDASKILADAAKAVGGGGGRNADIAIAGGRDPSKLDHALELARQAARLA